MPKTFSDSEREYIKKRLLEEVSDCLAQYGIRKTTVDDIVRRVGIPKGTFYLFYESKEALVFDAVLKLNTDIQTQLIDSVTNLKESPSVDTLTDMIFDLYKSLGDSFLLKLLSNGELNYYMQKAPPEFMEMNIADDDFMVDKLMALFPEMNRERNALYSAALRGAFLTLMHQKEIGYKNFDELLRMMIRGIVIQMFGG